MDNKKILAKVLKKLADYDEGAEKSQRVEIEINKFLKEIKDLGEKWKKEDKDEKEKKKTSKENIDACVIETVEGIKILSHSKLEKEFPQFKPH